MPSPVFATCAETIVQDKQSNLLSIINVIEKMTAFIETKGETSALSSSGTLPDGNPPVGRIAAVGVWEKSLDDAPDAEFEHGFAIYFPNKETAIASQELGTFRLTAEKPRFRQIIRVSLPPILNPLDNLNPAFIVEFRARAAGEEKWTRQEYRIALNIKHVGRSS